MALFVQSVADKGSKRRLWNEQSVARAIDYVLNGQGDDLPDFDAWVRAPTTHPLPRGGTDFMTHRSNKQYPPVHSR